jgi:HSP20 family protein
MTLWRWDTPNMFGTHVQEVERLKKEMTRLWDQITSPRAGGESVRIFPPVVVSEDDEYLYVRAELPGVDAGRLDLSVVDDQLVLRGERKTKEERGKVNYHRREREEGIFRRVIVLPSRVDTQKVEAKTKDGILTIKLAKAEAARPKPIEVQAG